LQPTERGNANKTFAAATVPALSTLSALAIQAPGPTSPQASSATSELINGDDLMVKDDFVGQETHAQARAEPVAPPGSEQLALTRRFGPTYCERAARAAWRRRHRRSTHWRGAAEDGSRQG